MDPLSAQVHGNLGLVKVFPVKAESIGRCRWGGEDDVPRKEVSHVVRKL